MYYTGVGSRETPAEIMAKMTSLAEDLAIAGWTLRSGGADGADAAFEQGANNVNGQVEIYLPWRGFNGRTSALFGVDNAALEMASKVHPVWDSLKDAPRKLHARNCYQVMGRKLDSPSAFTVCWTPDGCETKQTRNRATGGTGTAIALSSLNNVPVFNLQKASSQAALAALLQKLGVVTRFVAEKAPTEPSQGSLF